MAETKPPTTPAKVEPQVKKFEVEPGLMSLEDLDKVIADVDPESLKTIEGVKELGAVIDNQTIEMLQLDDYLDEASLKKNKIREFKLKMALFWVWLKGRIVEISKSTALRTVANLKQKNEQFKVAKQAYRHWPVKSKLSLVGGVALFFLALVYGYLALVKKKFDGKEELFMPSLLSWSNKTWNMSEETSIESFYNTTRIPKNIFNLKRMVVNIKSSENSGPNPMVAYEFSLEGNSTEVLIEIKDREGEIIDKVQRVIEEYSFDELNGPDGKKVVEEKVRSAINRVLTLGKIRYVYVVGVIFKP